MLGEGRRILRESRARLDPRPDDPVTPVSFREALEELERSRLRPSQNMIRRARVMAIARNFNLVQAISSVDVRGDRRYITDGHHTTIAAIMVGARDTAPFLDRRGGRAEVQSEISWLPRRGRFGLQPMVVTER